MPGHRRLPIPRPRPTRPVVTLPIDPLVQALKDHATQLHQAGVSLRLIADGARIPHSTLSDLMAGRRVHLTVADARALAGYLRHEIILARLPLIPNDPSPRVS